MSKQVTPSSRTRIASNPTEPDLKSLKAFQLLPVTLKTLDPEGEATSTWPNLTTENLKPQAPQILTLLNPDRRRPYAQKPPKERPCTEKTMRTRSLEGCADFSYTFWV